MGQVIVAGLWESRARSAVRCGVLGAADWMNLVVVVVLRSSSSDDNGCCYWRLV